MAVRVFSHLGFYGSKCQISGLRQAPRCPSVDGGVSQAEDTPLETNSGNPIWRLEAWKRQLREGSCGELPER